MQLKRGELRDRESLYQKQQCKNQCSNVKTLEIDFFIVSEI